MDKSNTRIDVDCNKISEFSKNTGFSLKYMSEVLGHSRSYFSDKIRRNKKTGIASISKQDYITFKILFKEDIQYKKNNDKLKEKDNKNDTVKKDFIESIEDKKISDLNCKDFYKLIYMAIRKATNIDK